MSSKINIVVIVLVAFFSSLSFLKSEPLPAKSEPAHQNKIEQRLEGKCLHCHGGGKALQQDLSDPECQECHGIPSLPPLAIPASVPENQVIMEQQLIEIPLGSFIMGSPGRPPGEGRGNADEGPPHEVSVATYYIDLYETTNAHYQEYLEATGAKPPLLWRGGVFPEAIANHPVVYVDWFNADDFCRWAGKRLPNEQEWEKAARGNDRRNS